MGEIQLVVLKKEQITLDEREKQILILLNESIGVSKITEIEQMKVSDIQAIFQRMCNKLCAKNQKEAYRRAKDLGLF